MNFEELYQEIVLDHSRRPRNFGPLADADVTVAGENPTCGDEIKLQLKLHGDSITDARFTGQGCAICIASASLMTRAIKTRSPAVALETFDRFHRAIEGDSVENGPPLGDLAALAGVRHFPQRVKCAMLPWQALHQALVEHSHEN